MTKLSPAARERAVQRYLTSTESIEEIGAAFGVCGMTVSREIRARGLAGKRCRHTKVKDRVRFLKLYEAGRTIRQICQITGFEEKSVSLHLHRAGVKVARGFHSHRKRRSKR